MFTTSEAYILYVSYFDFELPTPKDANALSTPAVDRGYESVSTPGVNGLSPFEPPSGVTFP